MNARLLILAVLFLIGPLAFGQDATLKPGERLLIRSLDDADLCVAGNITSDGYLYVPRLGALNAAGLTPEQFSSQLVRRLALSGRFLSATVSRAFDPRAPLKFSGSVALTGETPWSPGRRLSYLLKLAGPNDAAGLSEVEITDALGKTLVVDASAPNFANSSEDLLLRPGDQVYVPLRRVANEVFVVGEVSKPGAVAFEDGMDVAGAIAKAGGFSGHSDPGSIQVERDGKAIETPAALRRGDVVRVGQIAKQSFVVVQGAVKNPGIVDFKEGMTLSQAVLAAGGATSKADLSRVEVNSASGHTDLRFNLTAIRLSLAADPRLLASDVVDIPLIAVSKKRN